MPRIVSSLRRQSIASSAGIFAAVFAGILALHIRLLRLPYFWDEAGYYVAAARDLLLTGSLIPHTTLTNAHPPLVMAWLALSWKLAGFFPFVTRSAMLCVAAFALLGLFRLAELAANRQVAFATVALTALYPVFFSQSSLAQVDLAAAGLTFWGLRAYLEDRRLATLSWLALAALAKETAILAPLALLAWELAAALLLRDITAERWRLFPRLDIRRLAALGACALPLTFWFAYHYSRTGFVFGNPEFFRYNVQSTINPLRILIAFFLRLWQTLGYLHLYSLTLATVIAMTLPPQGDSGTPRPRISLPVQATFAAVVATYVVALAMIGGAVLARYMLPVVPLVILICVSTIWRRIHAWKLVLTAIAAFFIVGWFWNPPYGFSFEDNLAYRDYVELHQAAAGYLEAQHPNATVLTAWTASDELSRPFLGYVQQPIRVVRIENFTLEELLTAREAPVPYNFAVVFSTKYEPGYRIGDWSAIVRLKTRFFGYHRDLPPAAAARVLGGRIVMEQHRGAQWIAIIEMERAVDARLDIIPPADGRNVSSLPAKLLSLR